MQRLAVLGVIILCVAGASAWGQAPVPPQPASQTPAPPSAEGASKPAALATDTNGLILGPGHDITVKACSTCHLSKVVLSKRLDRSEWTELVENMADRGAKATDEELAQITDYLAANYPREKPTAAPPEGKPATPPAE